jgi:hypothetical protein
VGTAKRVPASFTPRRFASVTSATIPIEKITLCSARAGAADVMASIPATTETETVRT